MRFTSREDVHVPIEEVFAAITDFRAFERQLLNRGATVQRRDPAERPQVGSIWDVGFTFRGRRRVVVATLSQIEHPNLLAIDLAVDGLTGIFKVELLPLSRQKTRMSIALDLSASTLSARLLLQSLKLAKANLTRRFKVRTADFALSLERRTKPAHGRT